MFPRHERGPRRQIGRQAGQQQCWVTIRSGLAAGPCDEQRCTDRPPRVDQHAALVRARAASIALVFVNTLMIQQVLGEDPEARRAPSPLLYSHVNPYGVFRLDLSTACRSMMPPDVQPGGYLPSCHRCWDWADQARGPDETGAPELDHHFGCRLEAASSQRLGRSPGLPGSLCLRPAEQAPARLRGHGVAGWWGWPARRGPSSPAVGGVLPARPARGQELADQAQQALQLERLLSTAQPSAWNSLHPFTPGWHRSTAG